MKNKFSFSNAPSIKARRTKFDLSFGTKTSFNIGELVPVYLQEIYPGDTFKVDTSYVARMSNPFLRPVMDNLYLDTYYFYVPSRLLFDKWEKVFGASDNAWASEDPTTVPTVLSDTNPVSKTVADYLGLPVSDSADITNGYVNVSVLPFRAFAKIYDAWFRDENNIDPMLVQNGEVGQFEEFNNNDWSPHNYFGKLPKVSKFHDYFTSALPSPQKGDAIELTVGTLLPVKAVKEVHSTNFPVKFELSDLGGMTQGSVLAVDTSTSNVTIKELGNDVTIADTNCYVDSTNLVVDSNGLNQLSVNDLRYGLALQRMLEADARGGTRYIEYIYSHFGVVSPDARLQRPEYLTGSRQPLNIQQVANTNIAPTDERSLGQLGAYSLTNGKAYFSKSFVEHGYVIGVMCARYKHTYQQGIEKFWKRSKRTDFYDPIFANIGEQPIMATELYNINDDTLADGVHTVFGYNEAWADLRYRPNKVTGQMRSGLGRSQDIWHFADFYQSAPVLSQSFLEETSMFVDRTLSVTSSKVDPLILDIYFKVDAIRELPLYSIPSITEAPLFN